MLWFTISNAPRLQAQTQETVLIAFFNITTACFIHFSTVHIALTFAVNAITLIPRVAMVTLSYCWR